MMFVEMMLVKKAAGFKLVTVPKLFVVPTTILDRVARTVSPQEELVGMT